MIITDAHAHIYPCYNLAEFFSSAFQNFLKVEESLATTPAAAVLFLTEVSGSNTFGSLRDGRIQGDNSEQSMGWHVVTTDEHCSLKISNTDYRSRELILISGQQVVTKEKLEVLAIGCKQPQADKRALKDTVDSIFSAEGIVILPWGVGKWLGKRGTLINEFIAANNNALLFMGDNGSRPGCWPVSRLKSSGKTNPPRLLSGTDPLPLSGEEKRVGNFGSIIHDTIDPQKPFETLKNILSHPQTKISNYGRPQSVLSFVKQQVALRMAR